MGLPAFHSCLSPFLPLRLKGDLAYNYKGPRTKDDIVEFANRVAGWVAAFSRHFREKLIKHFTQTRAEKQASKRAYQCRTHLFHSSVDFRLWCSGLSLCINWARQIFSSLREIRLDPWQRAPSKAWLRSETVELLNPHWVVPPSHKFWTELLDSPTIVITSASDFWFKLISVDSSSSRPAVRALPSKQMFEHMMKRHDVLFVYVGGVSPLKVSTVCATSVSTWHGSE